MSVITLNDARRNRQPKLTSSNDASKRQQSAATRAKIKSDLQGLDDLGIKSFSHEYKALLKLVDADANYVSAKADAALKRAQMASVIRAISVADRGVEEMGSRGAYAFVALHGLARELAHDLRSFGGGAELVAKVTDQAVRPALQALAAKVIAKVIAANRDVYSSLPPKDAERVKARLRRLQREVAETIAESDADAQARVSNLLLNR